MKKLLLLITLAICYMPVKAQKHHLVYKEYQNYDSINYTYTPVANVLIHCDIDFNDSVITLGDKTTTKYATFSFKDFNIANDRLIYKCYNTDIKKDCALVVYVYGNYRYMEVIYSTKDKFKYRVRADEPITLKTD